MNVSDYFTRRVPTCLLSYPTFCAAAAARHAMMYISRYLDENFLFRRQSLGGAVPAPLLGVCVRI